MMRIDLQERISRAENLQKNRHTTNIYSREIEEFLYSHPAISDVQVVGVPDKKYVEELMAWIKLKNGDHADPEKIKAFCKGRIAHFKIPRYIKFVEDFPMTVSSKIQKCKMREESIVS